MTSTEDLVVLLHPDGSPAGTAPRATVHDERTPLHLAFSCHLLDADGRLLLTRRALAKRTWPGVWTNSYCGHPRPGEAMEDAVRRYGRHELGVDVTGVELLLPDFRYRAVDAGGVVENEHCPVFVARVDEPLSPHPDEVAESAWTAPATAWTLARQAPWVLSPWFVDQVAALGPDFTYPGTPVAPVTGLVVGAPGTDLP